MKLGFQDREQLTMIRYARAWSALCFDTRGVTAIEYCLIGSAFPSYSMRYKRILAYPCRFRKESWHPWNWKMLAEVAGAIP